LLLLKLLAVLLAVKDFAGVIDVKDAFILSFQVVLNSDFCWI
jgi:hypothetical protein